MGSERGSLRAGAEPRAREIKNAPLRVRFWDVPSRRPGGKASAPSVLVDAATVTVGPQHEGCNHKATEKNHGSEGHIQSPLERTAPMKNSTAAPNNWPATFHTECRFHTSVPVELATLINAVADRVWAYLAYACRWSLHGWLMALKTISIQPEVTRFVLSRR